MRIHARMSQDGGLVRTTITLHYVFIKCTTLSIPLCKCECLQVLGASGVLLAQCCKWVEFRNATFLRVFQDEAIRVSLHHVHIQFFKGARSLPPKILTHFANF